MVLHLGLDLCAGSKIKNRYSVTNFKAKVWRASVQGFVYEYTTSIGKSWQLYDVILTNHGIHLTFKTLAKYMYKIQKIKTC